MKLRNKKTGEIWNLINRNEGTSAVIWVSNGCQTYRIETIKELAEEWEDYEEPKDYYFIRSESLTVGYSPISNTRSCRNRKEIGNYFETKEEAEKAVEKLKAWKRLRDRGFKFEGYNAQAFGEIKFSIEYDWEDCNFDHLQHKADLDLLFGGEE